MPTTFPLNIQKPEKVQDAENGHYDVVSVWQTIQGEGPLAGTPAVFVRLAGCNLQCPLCDTDYTAGREIMSVADLVADVQEVRRGRVGLVVLTGGEPFRQPIGLLVQSLFDPGMRIQIETNGTLFQDGPWGDPSVQIVCSPKTGVVSRFLQPWIRALKYVVRAGEIDRDDGLPTSVLGNDIRPARPWPSFNGDVFVQPMDENDAARNRANRTAAVESCMRFGWRLSLQMHKELGLE